MGVLGLWQLLAPVGQPVTLESLENKIFAVDISIWLNQAVKGYRDAQGGSVPNAHLLSLFSRLCKLLFYKIRPIIVFDGGFPELKKQTIINRQQRRAAVKQSSRDFGLKILSNYVASQQLGSSSKGLNSNKFSFKTKEKHREEIFKLPPLPESSQNALSDSFDGGEDYERKFTNFSREDIKYLNQIDLESEDFEALPLDVKHEILSTLKESRKHASWEQYNDLPRESDAFSSYQMQCLLKKRKLQSKLEEVQKDMRRVNSSAYVSQYTNDHVIGETNKIMSDDTSYYVLLKKISKHGKDSSESEDAKPSASVMADTKDAFIRDVENIDFQDGSLSSKIKVEEENKEHCSQNENLMSDTDASSDKEDDIEFLEYETHRADSKIKREIHSLDLSDEEDVDNPPSLKELPHGMDQNICKSTNVCVGNNQHSTSNAPGKAIEKVNLDLSELERNEGKSEVQEVSATSSLPEGNIHKNTDMHIENDPHSMLNTPGQTADEISVDLPKFKKNGEESVLKSEVQEVAVTSSSARNNSEPSEAHRNVWMGAAVNNGENEPQSEIFLAATERDSQTESGASEDENSHPVSNDTLSDPVPLGSLDNASTIEREANLELGRDLLAETAVLEAEQAKLDRQSRTVQDHMVEECKELLGLFGIPYVVSPLEAEAQCAFYDLVDFTHGTITDDSDVWLFGGKRVYKNFFTQQKFVECYKDKEIFTHFGLSREKLINFALLTGSDYTEGIEGVGPVTAMEIISEFSGEGFDALQKFKDWWLESNRSKRPPENKVRAKLLKLVLAENFPDRKVFEAYLCPEVDSSREKFTWGRPDLDAIRDYTKERFGWNQSKVDSSLLPVLKKLNERDKQTHLDSFFTVTLKKEKNLFPSKRIMSALKKITSPQKQEEGTNVKRTRPLKRKPETSGTKPVRKKAVKKPLSNKSRRKSAPSQGPNLSEESSSDE